MSSFDSSAFGSSSSAVPRDDSRFYENVTLSGRFSDVPAFSGLEPGENQRWSTWTAVTPTSRGPKPWPTWLVTSASAFDTELGIVKTGKEADLFLIERAVPGDASQSSVLAAKRYRGADNSDFHRSSRYSEGRRMRNTRDTRAAARGTAYGRTVSAGRWAFAEFEALCRLHEIGVPVPYPVQVHGTEILMEFIGTGSVAAPRLAQVRTTHHELRGYYDQVLAILGALAREGLAHGDLSAYNLLVHEDRVVVIDLPQVVEVISNPSGMEFLHRDCVNVCDWFARQGVECDAEDVCDESGHR